MRNSNRKPIFTLLIAVGLIALIVVSRIIPHAANFAAVAAAALFAGYIFRSKWLALSVPVFGMLISDLYFVGTYDYRILGVVYLGLALPVLMTGMMKRRTQAERKSRLTNALGGMMRGTLTLLACSTVFFLLSNLAVWAFSGMYLPNAAGLAEAYVLAIPFYKYTILGDLFYGGVIFGAYQLALAGQRKWALSV